MENSFPLFYGTVIDHISFRIPNKAYSDNLSDKGVRSHIQGII